MPPVEGEPGWILHYRRYRETSLLLDTFTLAHGRVPLMARGALGPRAPRDLYQPFRPLLLDWHGASGLCTLRGLEASGAALALHDGRLACAYYVNELLLRLVGEHDPQPELFAHYTRVLGELASGEELETPLRRFELQLLERLGSLPSLAELVPAGVVAERDYIVDADTLETTVLDAAAGAAGSATAVARTTPKTRLAGDPPPRPELRRPVHEIREPLPRTTVVSGRSLIAMARLELDDARIRSDAKRLLRLLIDRQLGGRPLRSREVFAALSRGRPLADRRSGGDPTSTDADA